MTQPVVITIPGDPVPFARAGAQGKRRFTPRKQADFMAVVRMFAAQQMAGREPMDGPLRMILEAEYVPPASWSVKKRAAARWKATKPDADNLYKLAADSLNGVVFVDDAQISDIRITKTYASASRLVITVEPLA